jgi:hypothetical protein
MDENARLEKRTSTKKQLASETSPVFFDFRQKNESECRSGFAVFRFRWESSTVLRRCRPFQQLRILRFRMEDLRLLADEKNPWIKVPCLESRVRICFVSEPTHMKILMSAFICHPVCMADKDISKNLLTYTVL